MVNLIRAAETAHDFTIACIRAAKCLRAPFVLTLLFVLQQVSAEGVGHPPPCGPGETLLPADTLYRYSFDHNNGPFSSWADVGSNTANSEYACRVMGPPVAQANHTCTAGYTCTNYRATNVEGAYCNVSYTRTRLSNGQVQNAAWASNTDELQIQSVSGICVANDDRKDLGKQTCDAPLTPNPINPIVGNKYLEIEVYRGSGEFPINVTRRYNSYAHILNYTPTLGPAFFVQEPNWRMSYDVSVIDAPNEPVPGAYAWRPDGRVLFFRKTGSDYVPDDDVNLKLERVVTGGVWTGWRLTNEKDEIEEIDAAGYLQKITNRAGLSHTFSYNGTGRVISIRHSFGHEITFTQTTVPTSMTVPGGGTYSFGYDGLQNLTSITFPDQKQRTFVYANTQYKRAVTSQVDENSVTYGLYTYQSDGKASSSELAGGVAKYSVAYTSATRSTVTDPLLNVRTYDYANVLGAPKSTAQSSPDLNCGGPYKARQYDARGNARSLIDFKNVETVRTFNSRNLIESTTEASGTANARTTVVQWHSSFRIPTQIDEPGKRTMFTHDANGNVLTKMVLDTATSESRTWAYTYNAFGQLLTEDGPRTDVNDVTTYTYYNCTTGYQCGQVETITNALGQVTTYNSYNAHGQPLTITDPNGVVTTLAYDARQRLTSRTVGSEQTTFEYWPTGLLKKATLPDGSFIAYNYDAAHRLTGLNDSQGNRVAYTLDAIGNRTKEDVFDPANALTQTRTRVFNTLNRLTQEIAAAGTPVVTTTFGYDNNGNLTSINAPLARNTGQAFDELNRLTQVTDPATGLTKYGYNALDQLISVTDPRNKVTSYAYNALGDLTQQVSPDTGTTVRTYDSGGNLKTTTDARSKTGTYNYDALNRVTQLSYPDQSITYTYDQGANSIGRLSSLTDASGSTSWTYDAHGRVTSRQQNMGSVSKSVGYAYNGAGQLQSLTLPSGNAVTYGYQDGKVASVTLNGATTILSNALYQPFGPVSGWTWGNVTLAVREYDTDGKVTDIDSAGLKTYGYDDAFRVTGITDADNSSLSQIYGYDLLDRLTTATGTGLNQSWTYDANGNRLTEGGAQPSTYTISSANNRVTAIAGALTRTYSYDATGNTTGYTGITFAYDDAGRMVSATNAGATTNYSLNALGQRVRKTSSGSSTYFVYGESGQLLGEYDNSGNLIQETLWLDDIPIATLRSNGTGVDIFYIHTDHLNTPRKISRPSDNAIVWRWDSDPFGTASPNQNPSGLGTFVYNLRFPGQYADQETGLHQNYFRDYDYQTGRYVQSDPVGLAGGLNTYAYVGGNPLSRMDPSGLVGVPNITKLHDWLNPTPLSATECRQLREDIYRKNELLRDEIARYNPTLDGMGGWPMAFGSGLTKPGGHFKEIRSLQRGLKNDIKKYNQRCRCDGNNDGNPPLTRNVDELANSSVEPPVYPVFFIPINGLGGGFRPAIPGAALSPVLAVP